MSKLKLPPFKPQYISYALLFLMVCIVFVFASSVQSYKDQLLEQEERNHRLSLSASGETSRMHAVYSSELARASSEIERLTATDKKQSATTSSSSSQVPALTVEVTVDGINLREQPNLSAKVIRKLSKGPQSLAGIRLADGYIWGKLQSEEAWFALDLLQPVAESEAAQTGLQEPFDVEVVVDGVNLRLAPSLSAKIVKVIAPGVHTIVETKIADGHEWGRLKSGEGWIALDLLGPSRAEATPLSPTPPPAELSASSPPPIAEPPAPEPVPEEPPAQTLPLVTEPAVRAQPPITPPITPAVHYQNCTEAKQNGRVNIRLGEPDYAPHLDRDGDGIGCET